MKGTNTNIMGIYLDNDPNDRPLPYWACILLAVIVAGTTLTIMFTAQRGEKVMPLEPGHTTPTRCFEDEECWDCETMGNRTCGPNAEK